MLINNLFSFILKYKLKKIKAVIAKEIFGFYRRSLVLILKLIIYEAEE
jgi:hypothetical protein